MTIDSVTTIAKITPPRLTKILARTRLFKLLDTNSTHPVIWITGPPGSGKTTLAASYVAQNNLPCLWYRIDAGDDDIASFFYFLDQAAKRLSTRQSGSLPLLTPEYLSDVPTFTRNFFRDLYSRVNSSGLLVVDDYQEASATSTLHEVMQHALSEIPAGINVIVISRADPPANLARLRASGTITQLSWNELRLTQEECTDISQLRDKEKFSEQQSQQLHELTRGWVTGLVLLLEQKKIADVAEISIDLSEHTVIFNYFAKEIFENSDDKVKDLLVRTAFLRQITVEAAQELTDNHQAGAILAGLTRENYFTVKHLGPAPVYEYHPLFRQFLLNQANDALSAEQLTGLQQLSTNILIGDDQIEDAAVLLQKMADWQSLIRLVRSNAQDLIAQGRYQTLAGWLQAIPSSLHEPNPWLLFWLGHRHLPFDQTKAITLFEEAFSCFRVTEDSAGMYMSWATIVDGFFYRRADFTQLDKWIPVFLELRQSYPEFPSREIAAQAMTAMFSALMIRQPLHPELPRFKQLITDFMWETPDIGQRIIIGSRLLLHYVWFVGDARKAGLIIDALRPQVESATITPLASVTWYWMLAYYYWYIASPQDCLPAIEKGLTIARESGIHQHDFMLLLQQVMAELMLGGYKTASAVLEKVALQLQPSALIDQAYYHFTAALLAYHNDDLAVAQTHVTTAIDLADSNGMLWLTGLFRIVYAQILFLSGERKLALVSLSQGRRIGKKIGSTNLEFSCWLCVTLFAMELNKPRLTLKLLRKTLGISREYGKSNLHLWTPANMLQMFTLALENDIEVSYIQDLIRKHQLTLTPSREAYRLDNWPWPIKLFALGQFTLEVDGMTLALGNKKQNKPIELLKALIAFGGKGVSENKLIDALWPEADGDAAHHAFETNLYRLRKHINNNKALVFQDGLLSLNANQCWVDVWAFEELASQLEARLNENADPDLISTLTGQLTDLYCGPFLSASGKQPWALATFERLHQRRLRLLISVGQYQQHRLQWQAAIDLYQQGLEMDPLTEKLYQYLMVCHRQQGQDAEAFVVYEQCRRTLADMLKVEPSEESKAILQTLYP